MKVMPVVVVVSTVLAMRSARAEADPICSEPELEDGSPIARLKVEAPGGVRFVARIENPPRTKVALSIDNEQGGHYEIVWDPQVNDGLQHEILLPFASDSWTITPSSEIERVQVDSRVLTFMVRFGDAGHGSSEGIVFASDNVVYADGVESGTPHKGPKVTVVCRAAQRELSEMLLNKRKVTAIAKARGLLDTAVPAPVESALSILAEIAVDRARSGAMSLIRDKFVKPICDRLTFEALGFAGGNGRILPRTCTLAEQLQLQDVLSSGHALLRAVESDLRDTLVPRLIEYLPQLDEQTGQIAKLALELATRASDGHMDGVVELDYLVAIFDQLSWSGGFEHDLDLVEEWLKATAPDLRRAVIEASLPVDFDLPDVIEDSPWTEIDECKPRDRRVTITGAISYWNADRDKCVNAIADVLDPDAHWIRTGIEIGLFSRTRVLSAVRARASISLFKWLTESRWESDCKQAKSSSGWLTGEAWLSHCLKQKLDAYLAGMRAPEHQALEVTCGVRLVIGIAKWCSSQEACAAGEITELLAQPQKVFKVSSAPPWSVCWRANGVYRLPAIKDRYIDLGVRLVSFLNSPKQGTERERILAMIRWIFDVVIEMGDNKDGTLSRFHDVVRGLVAKDYVSALTSSLDIAVSAHLGGEFPKPAKRALQLIGAVASYARTYEETKGLDAAAARDARRKALESLIDAATDRRERSRDLVLSLGSNVGTGLTFSQGFDDGWDWWSSDEIAVRVPLSLSLQYLPDNESKRRRRFFGLHAGLQLFDLGQFARATANEVTWATFVAPGFEAGVLIGEPQRAVNLSVHVSYAPALAEDVKPVVRYGVALGFYVPFFDFN